MTRLPRMALALGTIGLVAATSLAASVMAPPGSRIGLLLFSVMAVAMAVQAVSSEPRDLIPAILLALVPVVALASEGAPGWLVGAPLAVLLLLAGEACALSWEVPAGDRGAMDFLLPRVVEAVILAALGLAAAVVVGMAGRLSPLSGILAVVIGAGALVILTLMLFGRRVTE